MRERWVHVTCCYDTVGWYETPDADDVTHTIDITYTKWGKIDAVVIVSYVSEQHITELIDKVAGRVKVTKIGEKVDVSGI